MTDEKTRKIIKEVPLSAGPMSVDNNNHSHSLGEDAAI
jgi:hypothetical protein